LRFVHAVPGAGVASLTADGAAVGGPAAFATATSYASVPDGQTSLRVTGPGGKVLARARESLSGGRFTAVATRSNGKVVLRVFRDGRARAGRARMRALNVAPELGRVDVALGERTLARGLNPGDAGGYVTADPGTYELKAARRGSRGAPLASRPNVNAVAGTASTALLVGSGGEPTRIVVVQDAVATPAAAPATGLGGRDGGPSWALALAAALAAGALGGAGYAAARRRGA